MSNAHLVLLIYLHISLHYSLVIKANMYLVLLYLISKAAAQEMNLRLKLSLRVWYESRAFRARIANSLPSEGEPVLQSCFALFRLLCIDATMSCWNKGWICTTASQLTSQAASSDVSIGRVVISNSFHFEEGKQWYLIFRDQQKQNSLVYAALKLLLQTVLESL